MRPIYVSQAECRVVAAEPAAELTTVLGSCIACCMWDPGAAVGGMNHFLLPGPDPSSPPMAILGAGSLVMEMLINECLKAGARRDALRARLFGGAAVVQGLSDVGARNAVFATAFLEREGIPVISASLGGDRGRRVRFWPMTGAAEARLVAPPRRERITRVEPGTVEFF